MSSCRETCVGESMWGRRRFTAPPQMRPTRGRQRTRGIPISPQGSLSAIRTHTRGAGHMGRSRGGELACTGRRWSASLIHLQRARPRRPVPLLIVHGDSRSASRPPCTFAVAPAICEFVSATDSAPRSLPVAHEPSTSFDSACYRHPRTASLRAVRGSSVKLPKARYFCVCNDPYAGSPVLGAAQPRSAEEDGLPMKSPRQSRPHARRSTKILFTNMTGTEHR